MNTVANQTSVETRKTIVTLHCQGLSVPEVARKLGVSAITVQTLVDYYQSIINRSQHEHPISLQDRAIVEAVRANLNITAAVQGGSPGQILRTDLTGASVKRKMGKDSEGSENFCMKKKCTLERKGDEVAVDVKHEEREDVKLEVIEEALEEEREMFDVTSRVQVIDGYVMANSWAQVITEDDLDNSSGTESAILPLPSPEGHRDDYSDTGLSHVPLLPPGVDTLMQEGLVFTEVESVLPLAPPKHHPVMNTMSLGDVSNTKLRTIPFDSQDSAQKRVNPGDSDLAKLSLVPHNSPRRVRRGRGRNTRTTRGRFAATGSTRAAAHQSDFQLSPYDDFIATMPVFASQPVGISIVFPEVQHDSDYFLGHLSNDLLDHIVNETNKYHAKYVEAHEMPPDSHGKKWANLTRDELLTFIALTLLMPHARKSLRHDYWNRSDLLFMPVFGSYMTRDRYNNILRFLHFTSDESADPLYKIRPVLQKLINKFSTFFKPFQNMVIDESFMLFKGRVKFKQYISSKRHHFGIKMYLLCDCETGIVLNLCIHSGSDDNITKNHPLGLSGSVVEELMKDYLGKEHVLYTDNWYTSPELARFLREQNTDAAGTVKPKRKHMPNFQTTIKGDLIKYKTRNMIAIKWHNKREVHLLSTVHSGQMKNTRKIHWKTKEHIFKPDIFIDYKENMRLVDKADMQQSSVDSLRKGIKWYKKVFFHLMDICMLNSYNIYVTKTGERSSLRLFRKNVIKEMLDRFATPVPMHSRTGKQSPGSLEGLQRLRAEGLATHYPVHVPPPPRNLRKKGQRECVVCKTTEMREKKRKLVTTMCHGCDVGLCLGDCFKLYHTLKTF